MRPSVPHSMRSSQARFHASAARNHRPTTLLITDDPAREASALDAVRHHAALYIDGMGARGKNFYNT
jgi:hypothetical protein